jgi:hypothetical protein
VVKRVEVRVAESMDKRVDWRDGGDGVNGGECVAGCGRGGGGGGGGAPLAVQPGRGERGGGGPLAVMAAAA